MTFSTKAGHQQPDDLDAFFQALGALLERREGNPQLLVLRLVPGGPEAELQPALGDAVNGNRLGGKDRRVAVGDPGHQHPEANSRGDRGQARQ
jgi:hypothetical protein